MLDKWKLSYKGRKANYFLSLFCFQHKNSYTDTHSQTQKLTHTHTHMLWLTPYVSISQIYTNIQYLSLFPFSFSPILSILRMRIPPATLLSECVGLLLLDFLDWLNNLHLFPSRSRK
jgi:hypothetical protein